MAKTRKQRVADLQLVWQAFVVLALVGCFYLWRRGVSALVVVIVFGLFVFAFILGLLAYHLASQRRLQGSGLAAIDRMTGEQFEEFLRALFAGQGYRARLTKNGADFGADILLERDGRRTVVQAKQWRRRDVGLRAVQEVAAAKAHYRADEALVVITGSFTQQAIDLARSNGVELWDRGRLAAELRSRSRSQARAGAPAAAVAKEAVSSGFAPSAVPPDCPRCGATMVEREGRYGRFWGCPSYPGCRGTRPA